MIALDGIIVPEETVTERRFNPDSLNVNKRIKAEELVLELYRIKGYSECIKNPNQDMISSIDKSIMLSKKLLGDLR